MAKKSVKNYIYAVGRRKSVSARVRLFKGNKESLVNGDVIGKYFPGAIMRSKWVLPFSLTNTEGKYYVTVQVLGGGKNGQLEATVHGISRAFAKAKDEFRAPLKSAGLLTRDARTRQRRMVGTGGKARRRKQSPKR